MADDLAQDLDQTAAELRRSLGAVYRRIRQTKALGDLTLPESSALGQLRAAGPIAAAALARLEQISPQSMATTVASLQGKGLVVRQADPADGRRQLLSITPAGNDIVDSRHSARTAQLSAALATLSAPERATLRAALPLLDRLAAEL